MRMLVVIQGPLLLKLGLQKLGWLAFFLFLSFWKQKNPDIVSKNKIIEMTKSPKAAAHSSELTPFRCLTSDIHTCHAGTQCKSRSIHHYKVRSLLYFTWPYVSAITDSLEQSMSDMLTPCVRGGFWREYAGYN